MGGCSLSGARQWPSGRPFPFACGQQVGPSSQSSDLPVTAAGSCAGGRVRGSPRKDSLCPRLGVLSAAHEPGVVASPPWAAALEVKPPPAGRNLPGGRISCPRVGVRIPTQWTVVDGSLGWFPGEGSSGHTTGPCEGSKSGTLAGACWEGPERVGLGGGGPQRREPSALQLGSILCPGSGMLL